MLSQYTVSHGVMWLLGEHTIFVAIYYHELCIVFLYMHSQNVLQSLSESILSFFLALSQAVAKMTVFAFNKRMWSMSR